MADNRMVQHVDGHRSDPKSPRLHDVTIVKGRGLDRIVGDGMLAVNTYHHQVLDRNTLAARFQPAAFDGSQGWVIEAFVSPEHTWFLGIQWHPERAQDFAAATLSTCAPRQTPKTGLSCSRRARPRHNSISSRLLSMLATSTPASA